MFRNFKIAPQLIKFQSLPSPVKILDKPALLLSPMKKKNNVRSNLTEHKMDYDIVEDIKKVRENISLFEMCNVPQQKEKLLKALEVSEERLPTDSQPQEEEIGEASMGGKPKSKNPPFLLTFEIFNHNMHNCLVDSEALVNVMPLSVCKKINGQPKPSTWRVV